MEITWVGEGVEEYGHIKDDPENVVVRVDPRYFRPTEVDLLLVSSFEKICPPSGGSCPEILCRRRLDG